MGDMDIAEFLAARYAEDEADAIEAKKDPDGDAFPGDPDDGQWTAYDHRAGRYDTDQRPFRLVGAEVQDTLTGWTVCETGRAGHAVAVSKHIARHDPARVLAEVAAKRAILADLEGNVRYWSSDDHTRAAAEMALEAVQRRLAALDATHPDYQPGWKVEGA
jgi:hypothetical protein